ncbi:decaprenyl-phosphate phosphoribosyltransferase [Calditrichota bacterium GD2]
MITFYKNPKIVALRPWQWSKNIVVLAPLVFSGQFVDLNSSVKAIFAMIIFSLISSAVYLINDLRDLENDQYHPIKKNRPIASGQLNSKTAIRMAMILIITASGAGLLINSVFTFWLLIYLLLMLAYSFYLKHFSVLDLVIIASGFVIRAIAGAAAIEVQVSVWLLLSMFTLALMLIAGKRRHELLELQDLASNHRKNMENYSEKLLDILLFIFAISVIVVYLLYIFFGINPLFNKSYRLLITLPFIVAGIVRYLILIYQHDEGGEPERTLFNDRWMQAAFLGYGLALFCCYR